MKWQDKMKAHVECTLNTILDCGDFELTIIDNHKFKVTEDGNFCYDHETIEHIPSNWRRFARKAITDIINTKVENYLKTIA